MMGSLSVLAILISLTLFDQLIQLWVIRFEKEEENLKINCSHGYCKQWNLKVGELIVFESVPINFRIWYENLMENVLKF
jgi:hypothetical protein